MSLFGRSLSLLLIYFQTVLQDNVSHVKFNDLTLAVLNPTSSELYIGSCTLNLLGCGNGG